MGMVIGAVSVACSLFTSLSGLTGESTDAGSDSGTVALDAGDAAAPDGPWCAQQVPAPTFCDDFDENPVEFDWEGAPADQGEIVLDPISVSSPRSARIVQATAGDAGNCAYERLVRTFKGPVTQIDLAFMIRTGNAEGDGGFERGIVAYVHHTASDGGQNCGELLTVYPASADVGLQNSTLMDSHPLTRYPILGKWTWVEWKIVAEGGGTQVSIKLDGVTVLDGAVAPQCGMGGDVFVALGFHCYDRVGEVRFDNVRLTLR
jgi:hypothetical protein